MPKLLIVDDEMDVREFAKRFFEKRGVEVFTAASGLEAKDVVDHEALDLILLDIRMEEMTGVEFLRDLRASGNQTRVIMVSGIEDESAVKETHALGITGFIHKPLILGELQKVVMEELKKT